MPPALVIAGLLMSFAGCGKTPPATTPVAPPTVVELAPIMYSTSALPVRLPGVLSRKEEADLAFKVGGVVEEVSVRPGDAVANGQVLARLRLDEIEAQLTQARSALAKAERDLGRIERLQANAVATLEDLQDARTAVELAAAQVRIAEFNRRFAVITAPAEGHILRRMVEPNEHVTAGRAVLGFAADGSGWLVRAGVADADLARVRIGDRAEILLSAGTGGCVSGAVTHISGAANPVTRTTEIEILLDAMPVDGRSGVVVGVTLHPQPVQSRPMVPVAALIEGEGKTASIFVVENGGDIARRQPVELETIEGATAYLRHSLSEKVQLVVRGGEYLRDGGRVTTVAP